MKLREINGMHQALKLVEFPLKMRLVLENLKA
jgi:hypothetical protein